MLKNDYFPFSQTLNAFYLYILEEMSSVIDRRQSQTKSFSNNKNGTRKLSHENVDNNIHNRINSEEDEWYARQLEEIKHLPIHEILQRILHWKLCCCDGDNKHIYFKKK